MDTEDRGLWVSVRKGTTFKASGTPPLLGEFSSPQTPFALTLRAFGATRRGWPQVQRCASPSIGRLRRAGARRTAPSGRLRRGFRPISSTRRGQTRSCRESGMGDLGEAGLFTSARSVCRCLLPGSVRAERHPCWISLRWRRQRVYESASACRSGASDHPAAIRC